MGTHTILRLEKDSIITGSPDAADYPMMDIRWEGRWQPGRRALIYSANVDHTGIIGPGRIDGNPAVAAPQNPRGVVVLEPISCNDLHWEGFTVTQGGNWATHPTYCTDVVIKNLNIRGNRDGIDIDSCKNVRIEACDLDTGDDSISLKSGRGLNGARIGKPTEDVLITNCTLRSRVFACLGIGSEISAGVRNVRIEHCTMTANSQAIYLKTRIGRAGITEDIVGDDLDILAGGFLRINLTTGGNTNTADDPVEGLIGYPSARNLAFSHIRLNNASVIADCTLVAPEKPIENLTLADFTGTAIRGISMLHVKNAVLKNLNITGVTAPMLATDDVTGTGLDGAVKYTAPAARGALPARGFPPAGMRGPGTTPAP
jgi:polygalacturonase